MRRIFTISFLFITCIAFAQPANDDCAGLIDLGIAPFCDETVFFTNVDATPSDIGIDNIPPIGECFAAGTMENDVWFSFIASDTIEDYSITVTGITDGMGSTAMVQPQVAIYRGDCEFDGLEALNCAISEVSSTEVNLELSGLDAGIPYYVRISDWSTGSPSVEGTFQLCIEEKIIWSPDEDVTITTCNGDLYDAGGAATDYSSNLDYTVTIEPDGFQPGGCLYVNVEYFNVEYLSDNLSISDATGTLFNSETLTYPFDFNTSAGAGIPLYSSTGSVDIDFQSNGNLEFDGFYITWECSSEACPDVGTVAIDTLPYSPDLKYQVIEELLSTPYAEVSVTEINCNSLSIGTFETDEDNGLGIQKGIVLSSGYVNNINKPASSINASDFTGSGTDADLNAMSNLVSQDACYIELEVYANTDLLTFDYRFGSEEYPEFTTGDYNDIFALLISDDGNLINGPINGKENLAVLADGTPVQINSVNTAENWEYYTPNATNVATSTNQTIVFDGLTSGYLGETPFLTANRNVEPCNVYTLKFAIADRGDSAYDSGVFISEIRGSTPTISGNTNFPGMNYVLESDECKTNGFLSVTVPNIPSLPEVYQIELSGTANLDDLNINLPDSIIISESNPQYNFVYSAVNDGIDEGTETFTINLTRDYGCGSVIVSSYDIVIREEVELQLVGFTSDSVYVCPGDSIEIEAIGAELYNWTPIDNSVVTINPTDEPITTIAPTESTQVILFGYLAEAPLSPACRDVDTIQVVVTEPEVEIVTDDLLQICVGDTINLTAENNVGDYGVSWTPSTYLSSTILPSVSVIPTGSNNQTYIARVDLQSCVATDTISIEIDPFTLPEIIDDQQLCESYPIQLGEDVGNTTTTYEWLPDVYLDDNTSPNPTSNPEDTITYTFIATSENAFCADTSQVTIEVIEADIDILLPVEDSLEICLGDTIFVDTELTFGGTDLQWTPDNGTLSSTSSADFQMYPGQTTTYYATYNVGPCLATDSIFVRVDSLPNLDIDEFLPFKDPYCQGDSFIIVSNIFQPINYPDIEHLWTSAPGGLTSDTMYNMVVNALESGDFTRITTNRGCSDTISTFIEVIEPFLSIEPQDPIICPGESVELSGIGPDNMELFNWTSPNNLSCDTCQVTTATPGGSETFNLSAVVRGCEDNAEVTVFVTEITNPGIQDLTICLDETIILNENGPFDSGSTYTWTLADETVVGTDNTLEISPTEQTTYYLLMEEGNCSEEYEITIDVINEPPTLSASDDLIICIGESVELTATSSSPGTFTWTPGDLTGNPVNVSPTENTVYTVIGEYGCFEVEDSVSVTVGQGFFFDSLIVDPIANIYYEGDNIQLTAYPNPPNLLYDYAWTGEGLIPANSDIVSVTAPSVDEDGTNFTYTLEVVDQFGCTNSIQAVISVNDSKFAIPNAFRPESTVSNNTGSDLVMENPNKKFYVITNAGTTVEELLIFNRWGEQVFEGNEDLNGFSWDGKINGNPAPMDVYVYYVKLRFNDGTEREERGEVTLLR